MRPPYLPTVHLSFSMVDITILSAEITSVGQDLKKGLPKLHKDMVSLTIFPIFPMFTIIIFFFGGESPRIPPSNAPEIYLTNKSRIK